MAQCSGGSYPANPNGIEAGDGLVTLEALLIPGLVAIAIKDE